MFASLKRYIDFARSSDARLPRMVAEIDVTASLIKRLVLFETIYRSNFLDTYNEDTYNMSL